MYEHARVFPKHRTAVSIAAYKHDPNDDLSNSFYPSVLCFVICLLGMTWSPVITGLKQTQSLSRAKWTAFISNISSGHSKCITIIVLITLTHARQLCPHTARLLGAARAVAEGRGRLAPQLGGAGDSNQQPPGCQVTSSTRVASMVGALAC